MNLRYFIKTGENNERKSDHHHKAMKYVVPVRQSLGFRTIFNLLGPLANPAGTKHQLIGVFDPKWLVPMAETLRNLGTKSAWIVHGTDGLDEITTTAETKVAILKDGSITEQTLTPEDFGVERALPESLKGGDAEENAVALLNVLKGEKNAYRDIVLVNTAAVLNIHGSCHSLKESAEMAAKTIDSGAALQTLHDYASYSQAQKS